MSAAIAVTTERHLIVVRELTKEYVLGRQRIRALDRVSLSVAAGGIRGGIGRRRAGKAAPIPEVPPVTSARLPAYQIDAQAADAASTRQVEASVGGEIISNKANTYSELNCVDSPEPASPGGVHPMRPRPVEGMPL